MRRNQITLIHFNASRWPLSLFFLSHSTTPLIPSLLCLPPRVSRSFFISFIFLSPFFLPPTSLLGGTVHGPVQ